VSSSSGASFLAASSFFFLSNFIRMWCTRGGAFYRSLLCLRAFVFFGKDGVCRFLVETNAPENARMRRKKYPRARFARLPRGFAFARRLFRRVLSHFFLFSRIVLKPENPLTSSLFSRIHATTVRSSSSSSRQSRMRIVAKDQNSRPSLDELAEFKINPNDTGSASLQIALLTKRIENLTVHLQANRKDYATQRGLKLLLGRRGRLQKYLAKEDPAKYQMTMKGLGLKIKSA